MATLNIKNLPDSLYESLKLRAESQHRSVAQEVTHILSEVEVTCEQAIIINRGRVAAAGTLESLRAGGKSLEERFVQLVEEDSVNSQ